MRIWAEKKIADLQFQDFNGKNCLIQDVLSIVFQLRFSVLTMPGDFNEKYFSSVFPMLKALLLTRQAREEEGKKRF